MLPPLTRRVDLGVDEASFHLTRSPDAKARHPRVQKPAGLDGAGTDSVTLHAQDGLAWQPERTAPLVEGASERLRLLHQRPGVPQEA